MANTCRRSLAELLDDAIGLFLEYRDRHGYDEDRARAQAGLDILEGDRVRCVDMGREPCADCRQEETPEILLADMPRCPVCGLPGDDMVCLEREA